MRKRILGIELIEGERRAKYIPQGEIVHVTEGPQPATLRLAEVEWKNREFSVFVVDLEQRAEEIRGDCPSSPTCC